MRGLDTARSPSIRTTSAADALRQHQALSPQARRSQRFRARQTSIVERVTRIWAWTLNCSKSNKVFRSVSMMVFPHPNGSIVLVLNDVY